MLTVGDGFGWIAAASGLAGALLAASAVALMFTRRSARQLRRVLEAERRAAAAERLAEVGAMTAGLAHEIKNPLSTIGLNAQLVAEGLEELRRGVPDDRVALVERLERRVGTLSREVERLGLVLGEFLEFAGELKLQRSAVDLNTLVDELADFFLPQAEAQGVRLRFEPGPGPVAAEVDASHVKQALLNLMINAVQAMARADTGRAKELLLRVSVAEDRTRRPRVHVIDTGPGIDPETLSKIFVPYFTTRSGGTGLGLPIARRIAEAHGGSLRVRTETGLGTEFELGFPASEPGD